MNRGNKKAEYTKNQLHTALLDMMERTAYDEISVKDICERAGISRAAFYRNYEDKQALTKAVIEASLIRPLREELKERGVENWYSHYDGAVAELWNRQKDLIRLLWQQQLFAYLVRQLPPAIREAMPEGALYDYRASHLAFAAASFLSVWAMHGCRENEGELSAIICQLRDMASREENRI